MKADLLIHLYPRAWRDRYGDEMRALLGESRVTLAVTIDLLVGAVREWVRALTRQPHSPVSLDREHWRGWARSAVGTLVLAGLSWGLAGLLLGVGVPDEDRRWFLILGSWYPAQRMLIVHIRCARIRRRALEALPDSTPHPLAPVGIGPVEFWLCAALLVVGSATYWMDSNGPGWVQWLVLFFIADGLRNAARSVLARRDLVMQLAREERQLQLATP